MVGNFVEQDLIFMARRVVKMEPNTVEWYEEMAKIEYDMGHINTAEDFWSKAKALRNKEKENGKSN